MTSKIKKLLFNNISLIFLITLFTFFYFLVNPTVYVDDSLIDFYLYEGGYYVQGRIGALIFHYLFLFIIHNSLYPFFGIIFLVLSSYILAKNLHKFLDFNFLFIFSFSISFPLIIEHIFYDYQFLVNNFATLIVFYSTFQLFHEKEKSFNIRKLLFLLFIGVSISVYESLLIAYLIIRIVLIRKDKYFLKNLIYELPYLLILLFIFSLQRILPIIFIIDQPNFAAGLNWFPSFFQTLRSIVERSIFFYGFNSFFNYSIMILLISIFLYFFFLINIKKNFNIKFLLFFTILILPLSIAIITNLQIYRASLLLNNSIPIALSYIFKIKFKNAISKKIMIVLPILNLIVLNYQLSIGIERNNQERIVLKHIYELLINDNNLPVVFVNHLPPNHRLMNFTHIKSDHFIVRIFEPVIKNYLNFDEEFLFSPFQSSFDSVINWGEGLYLSSNDASQLHYISLKYGFFFQKDTKNLYINSLVNIHDYENLINYDYDKIVIRLDKYLW